MVIFCRPGWSAGHKNMTIESIAGLGHNSTWVRLEYLQYLYAGGNSLLTCLCLHWTPPQELPETHFCGFSALHLWKNKLSQKKVRAYEPGFLAYLSKYNINLQILRHKKPVCLCVCVCIWKQICRMQFLNRQALDFINGPHSDFMKEYIAENESLTCGLNEFCFLLSWILPFNKSTKRWIWEYKLCFLHHGLPDGLCKYS